MAKTVELVIDVLAVVSGIAEQYKLKLPRKIVMFHYDDSADTLYVHFQYPAKSVDSKIVDDFGEIVLGLDEKHRVVNLTVINASSYNHV
jgi:uncharacterized protein YuzE